MPTTKQLYDSLLRQLASDSGTLGSRKLTLFCPIKGRQSASELMVVGRAVNGWSCGWSPGECHDPQRRQDFIETSFDKSNDKTRCALLRVTERWKGQVHYNYGRSAFWRVIRRVTEQLRIADVSKPEWPSFLIWSDLYKVSRHGRGNPGTRLRRVQFANCQQILSDEISTWKPKRLLFLTG